MEEIVWKTTCKKQAIEIRAETKASSRRDYAVKLIHVHFDKYEVSFVVRIVNKDLRSREVNNFNSSVTYKQDNGFSFLVNEISIRSQFTHIGLCSLVAVRDSEQFVFLFEELCELGVAMTSCDETFIRDPQSAPLKELVKKSGHIGSDFIEKWSNEKTFCEAEACFFMWKLLSTLRDLHNNQICHLDIRPDNIYISASGDVKLGGLSFVTNFSNDLFGGLRTNFPGRKDFLPPEYWQGGRISCYAVDIWATVVSLYVLITGKSPFPIRRLDFHIESMSHYSTLPDMNNLSVELKKLLSSCFSPRLLQRLTVNQMMSHEWFVKHGYIDDLTKLRESVTLTHQSSTTELAIPTKWTDDDHIPLNSVIDSCFTKIMDVMYGGVEFAEDTVEIQPKNDSISHFVSVPSQEAIRLLTEDAHETHLKECSLPKRGELRYSDNRCCIVCWSKKEVYIERGKLVIGGLRKRNSRVYSILDITNIIFDDRDPCLFKLQWRNGNLFSFRALSKEAANEWYLAINLSISLC